MTAYDLFKKESLHYFRPNLPRIQQCVDSLTDEQLWYAPNPQTNSVANLVLHLCGNIRQYVISGLGGQPDTRQRPLEFSQRGGLTAQQLNYQLDQCITSAATLIEQLTSEQLETIYHIQGFTLTGYGVVIHVTEHLSYHTGQIALLTKMLTGRDLGFWDEHDL